MSEWIHRQSKLMHLPEALAFRLDLCATEVVTNIITYAYDGALSRCLLLGITRAQSHVNLEVEDDGKPFNPLEFPPAQTVSSLEQAPLGGRGIHLIRSLTSECKYQRRDGKNIFTMIWPLRDPLE